MKKLLLVSLIAFAICPSAFSQTNNTAAIETQTATVPYEGVRVFPNPSADGVFYLKIENNQISPLTMGTLLKTDSENPSIFSGSRQILQWVQAGDFLIM